MIIAAISAAAAAGAASTIHCAAMCGPLAAFAGRRPRGAAQYHAARSLAYALAGSVAGATGGRLGDAVSGRWAGALLSWSLALALGWTAWVMWRGPSTRPQGGLLQLGRRRSSLARRLYARLPKHPAVVGAASALLPCGTLYAALLIASGSGSALGGALSMLTFAGASALGLGALSMLASRARQRLSERPGPGWLGRGVAVVLLVGAILLAVRPIDGLRQDEPAACCHGSRG